MNELERLGRDQLVALAREALIPGRSTMTKAHLVEALGARLRAQPPSVAPSGGRPRPGGHPDRRWHASIDRDRTCGARLPSGIGCDLPPRTGEEACGLHGGGNIGDVALPILGEIGPSTWPALRRHQRLASYDPDPLGLDPVAAEIAWWAIAPLYRQWFKVEVQGIEHVPMGGPGLIVPNHGGGALPYDAMMVQLALLEEAPVPRRVRMVGTEIFNLVPWLSHLYRRTGGAYAARADADFILSRGHLLGVFPEGAAGFQKPHSEAYRVRRFGRGGFAASAASHRAPIVPVAIVGSEDTHPIVFSSPLLARLVRLVFPEQRVDEIGVFLNPLPLPVRWRIRFLPPIHLPEGADRLDVLEAAEATRRTIQANLDEMLGRK